MRRTGAVLVMLNAVIFMAGMVWVTIDSPSKDELILLFVVLIPSLLQVMFGIMGIKNDSSRTYGVLSLIITFIYLLLGGMILHLVLGGIGGILLLFPRKTETSNNAISFSTTINKETRMTNSDNSASHEQKSSVGTWDSVYDYDVRRINQIINDKLGFPENATSSDDTQNEDQESKPIIPPARVLNNPSLTRAFIFLEEGDYKKASEYVERALDHEPNNPMAYLAGVMIEIGKNTGKSSFTIEDLFFIPETKLFEYSYYKNALRFSNEEFTNEYLDKRRKTLESIEAQWLKLKTKYSQIVAETERLDLLDNAFEYLTSKEIVNMFSFCDGYDALVESYRDKARSLIDAVYKELILNTEDYSELGAIRQTFLDNKIARKYYSEVEHQDLLRQFESRKEEISIEQDRKRRIEERKKELLNDDRDILFCKNCSTILLGNNSNTTCPSCGQYGKNIFETHVSHSKWMTLSEAEKEDYKKSWSASGQKNKSVNT